MRNATDTAIRQLGSKGSGSVIPLVNSVPCEGKTSDATALS